MGARSAANGARNPDTTAEHECERNLAPQTQKYDFDEEIQVFSGTTAGDGVTVFMECRVCGKRFDAEFEYVETVEA